MEDSSDANVSSTSGPGERNVVAEGYYAIDNNNGDIYNPGFGQGGEVGGRRVRHVNVIVSDGEIVGDSGDGQGRPIHRRVDDGNNDDNDDDDDDNSNDDNSIFTSDKEGEDEEDKIDTGEIFWCFIYLWDF